MKSFSINLVTFLLFAAFELRCLATENGDEEDFSKLFDRLVDPSIYNIIARPNIHGPPVQVSITLNLFSISKVDEINMEITCSVYLAQRWNDPRLSFKPVGNNTEILLTPELWPKIWKPDTEFYPLIDLKQPTQLNTGGTKGIINITSNGNVELTTSLTLTVPCPMNLANFPADQQKCDLLISSAYFNDLNLVYKWSHFKLYVSPKLVNMPNHRLTHLYAGRRTMINTNYTELYARIVLERNIGYYVNQIYVPAFLVVLISWIPFWLQRDHHARVGLGVTTVLTITTLITNTMTNLPKVSYIKSLDIYLFTSFIMVFLSLVEYAIVGYFESDVEIYLSSDDLESKPQHGRIKRQTARIDYWSRALFPAIFFAFNAYYIWHILNIFRLNQESIPHYYTPTFNLTEDTCTET